MRIPFAETESWFEFSRSLRRDFHQHPELGYQEVRTAGIVARELHNLGLEITTGIAETGVVGLLEGGLPGPVVMLRFDMDALPIQEETGAEYASQNPGVMHACGHDAHTAIGLTVAKILTSHQSTIPGTLKFVFQPAEEGLKGAERMVVEGVLENPRPDVALGLHIWNDKPLGWMGITPGPVMAAAEIFRLTIKGRGGHGASPHQTVDPVLAAAQVITALQSIPARNVSPLDAAVVSVTVVEGGSSFNVIPPEVNLQGTIRTFTPEVRALVIERFHQIVTGVGEALGCQAEINMQLLTPAVVNDPTITSQVLAVVRQLFPEDHFANDYQTMGSEDMAIFLQQIPGAFLFVGSADPARGLNAAHHHPRFDFDERVLSKAAAVLANAALEMLASPVATA